MPPEDNHTPLTRPLSHVPAPAADRHRDVSERLRETSRLLAMQSGSRRGMYRVLGLQPRRRDRVFRILFAMAFVLCCLAPLAGGTWYILAMLSPRYEAETRFVLRSALPALPEEGTPNDANLSSLKIVQDTLVLVNFLDSPAFVARLDQEVSLDRLYARPEIDLLSRLTPGESVEDKIDYFEHFITTDVSSVSGIVTVQVRAFDPQDAYDVLDTVFRLSEERVNLLNRDIWASVLSAAETNFQSASDQLRDVRQRYGVLQNETGLFDVELEAEALADVLTQLRIELIDLQNRRNTLLLEVPETHVNVVRFNQAITVRAAQIALLEDEIAGTQGDRTTLANNQQRFDALEVEVDIAQERFKTAAIELEQAKLLSSVQMLYLDRFVTPIVPQDRVYPIYPWELGKLLVACLALWATAVLVLTLLQRRLD